MAYVYKKLTEYLSIFLVATKQKPSIFLNIKSDVTLRELIRRLKYLKLAKLYTSFFKNVKVLV